MELNNQLKKYIKSLHISKYRNKNHKFIVEGPKVAQEFLSSKVYPLDYILCLENWLESVELSLTHEQRKKVIVINQKTLNQISNLKNPNKVLLVLDQNTSINPDSYTTGWHVFLDSLQDPGNMGTILRIADWYAFTKVLTNRHCADIYNPKVVQSAMGAHTRLTFEKIDEEAFHHLKKPIYGMTLNGNDITKLTSEVTPGTIVIGNESKGINNTIVDMLDYNLYIPKKGNAESLNAAVAFGISCQLLTS